MAKIPIAERIGKVKCKRSNSFIGTNVTINQDRYFPTMGILRPMPKALGETRRMGGVW